MSTLRGRRVVLITAAAALAAGTAGVALGDGHDEPPPAGRTVLPALQAWHPSWSFSVDGGDVIRVRSHTCPKGHPHKVGSFSFSTTRNRDGRVTRHSSAGSLCAK